MMNNWTDLVVSLAVAAVPIIGAWISKQLLANKPSKPLAVAFDSGNRTAIWTDMSLGTISKFSLITRRSLTVYTLPHSK